MVQQMIDSKFSEYGLANAETGLPKHDKQLSVPLAAKKTPLRDLQNESRSMVAKSMGCSLFLKEAGPSIEGVKVSGTKRSPAECLMSSPHHQSPTSNAANGHLVYVRRKSEAEFGKSSTCDNSSNNVDCPQPIKVDDQDKRIQQQSQMKDSKICIPEAAPIPRPSSMCLSSGKPSVPLPLGKSSSSLTPADSNHIHITSSIPSLECLERMDVEEWEERYCRLQNLIRVMDQSNLDDYVQWLQSLSSVEHSRLAVELEKRSIQLSLEEAKEMQRVRLLDVLGRYPMNSRAPSTQQDQSER